MVFSEYLAERIRNELAHRRNIQEKRMFGGVGYLLNGNMCVGVWKESLVVRVGPEQYEDALNERFVGRFDITGRPMKGWVLVSPDGIAEEDDLREWIQRAVTFVKTLPAK